MPGGRPREKGCGTPAGHKYHERHKTPICGPCAQAKAIYQAEMRERLGYVWFQPARMYVRTSELGR